MPGPYISQVAESTPFDNSTNGFGSENVQAAIEEVMSLSSGLEFSFSGIDANITIKNRRQMLVYQEIEILAGFTLDIQGELVVID